MKHRARLRRFEPTKIEHIVRHSSERYVDTATRRFVAVGRHDGILVMIPYEVGEGTIILITVHATTRQQITFRLKTGRFTYE